MPGFGYQAKHPDYVESAPETKKHPYLSQLKFQPRVQIIGRIHWLCPACGRISRAHLAPKTGWEIHCTGHGCANRFALGFVLYQIVRGFKRPSDWGLPIDPLPVAELDYLEPGDAANRAIPCTLST